jgi:hypothetical protein
MGTLEVSDETGEAEIVEIINVNHGYLLHKVIVKKNKLI